MDFPDKTPPRLSEQLWFIMAACFGLVFAMIAVLISIAWMLRATPEERFADCMDLARQTGHFSPDDRTAAEICLFNATRPKGSASDETFVPIVLPGLN